MILTKNSQPFPYTYLGLSTEAKPIADVIDGPYFIELDTNKKFIFNSEWYEITEYSKLVSGAATSGSLISLVDTSKDLEADLLLNKNIKMTIGGVDYIRKITGNTSTALSFATLPVSVASALAIGSGNAGEGKVDITCIGALDGAAGNEYSIEVVQGEATTADTLIALVGKVLTITVNLDAESAPRTLTAEDLVALINGAAGITDQFEANVSFTAGNIPIGEAATPFAGGIDSIPVTQGTPYMIF